MMRGMKLKFASSAILLTLLSCGGSGGSGGSVDIGDDDFKFITGNTDHRWYFDAISYDRARQLGLTGDGVVVGLLDTGVDIDSPYLQHALSSDSARFINGRLSTRYGDNQGHGTDMASLIVGYNPDTHDQTGIAPNVELISVAVNNNYGDKGNFDYDSSISEGVRYAVANGADILNVSFGGVLGGNYDDDVEAFRYAMQNDVIVFFAAGNNGNYSMPLYYARMVGTRGYNGLGIAVTALDENGKIAGFASPCDVFDPYYCLSVPGEQIRVISDPTFNNGSYHDTIDGTSPATAIASGSMALLLEYFPNLTPHEAVEILLVTADDLGPEGVDYVYGSGALNLQRALQPVGATTLSTGREVSENDNVILSPMLQGSQIATAKGISQVDIQDDYQRQYYLDARGAIFDQDNQMGDIYLNTDHYIHLNYDSWVDFGFQYGQVGVADNAYTALGKSSILNRDIPFATAFDLEASLAKSFQNSELGLSFATSEENGSDDWQISLDGRYDMDRLSFMAGYSMRQENGRFLGSEFSPAFANIDKTRSQTIRLGLDYDAAQFDFGLQASLGMSDVELKDNDGIFASFDDIRFSSIVAKMGRSHNIVLGDRFDVAIGRQFEITDGVARLNEDAGLEGDISLVPEIGEWLFEAGYALPLTENTAISANFLHIGNSGHQKDENEQIFRAQIEYKF